ncbi:hypothetical protein JB92DRAFT_2849752 [Gautieria morchelliformis]|nr:hypothetical protein JB92DRAFT_2849752 [Gautieria morchelliformis]
MEYSGLNSSSSLSRRNKDDVICRLYHRCCLMDVFSLQQLSEAVEKFHLGKWEIDEGDSAFYGPKIDIKIHSSTLVHFIGIVTEDF